MKINKFLVFIDMKYVLFSIENINNGGDEMLRVTTEHLVEMVDCNSQCVQVQTHPKRKQSVGIIILILSIGPSINPNFRP